MSARPYPQPRTDSKEDRRGFRSVSNRSHPLIGKRVVSRAPGSGVHIGTLVDANKDLGHCLENTQRIWSWEGALDTSTIAARGVSAARISPIVPGISVVSDGRELYPISENAEREIAKLEVWSR